MTASVATYPHEVIRTRLQTQRRPLADDASSDGMIKRHPRAGIVRTTQKLIAKEGWSGLYKGLSINLLRTVPNSAVTMLTCVSSPAGTYMAHPFVFFSQIRTSDEAPPLAVCIIADTCHYPHPQPLQTQSWNGGMHSLLLARFPTSADSYRPTQYHRPPYDISPTWREKSGHPIRP